MKSQYLKPYMDHVKSESIKGNKPLSVGTFLVYRLRGNARSWLGRYYRSLVNGLEKEGWAPIPSKLNGLAYGPKKA